MIRVLIAEDSDTTRSLLVAILQDDPEIRVVGEAADGAAAVEMARELKPDVITMDVRMPKLDGFEATRQIMALAPTPVVILSSTLDPRDVEGSLQALRAGAVTVARKPGGPTARNFDEMRRQLVRTIKSMAQVKVVQQRLPPRQEPAVRAPGARVRPRLVAVAASVGGPAALHRLFSELPAGFPAPILVVQHIAPGFVPGLASWLQTATPLKVKVAERGERLKPATVYLAPDDWHLGVADGGTIALSQSAPIDGFRPSGSFLFESVARVFGGSAVAVVLTGMGSDGLAGLHLLHRMKAPIVLQDEASCVVFGMPGAAAAAGLGDFLLPLGEIAAQLSAFFASKEAQR